MRCHTCNAEIPDSAILCKVCGAVVTNAPASTPEDTEKRHYRINRRRFFAFGAAILLLVVGVVGILVDNGPEAIAKRYMKAYADRDVEKMLSLYAGDMRARLEDEKHEVRENLFRTTEKMVEDAGVHTSIHTFHQYYQALHTATKHTNADRYGEDYTITVKVQGTENMSVKEFNVFLAVLDAARCHDYIDTDKLNVGKIVTVSVTIAGSKDTETIEQQVPLVKYKGAWKVAANPDLLF